MKKILLVLSVCFLTLESSAQTTQRLILVEEYTNASCGPCALSNPAFDALMTANASKVVAVRYHTSFPGYDPFYSQNPVQNQARSIYYQVTSVPTARMDGAGTFLQDVNQTSIDVEYNIAPQYAINLNFHLSSDNDSVYASATFKALQTVTGILKAHIMMVEKVITFSTPPGSNGETSFPMVMKKMLPSETGTTLPATMFPGDSVVINVGWLISNVFNLNQLALVAFVQDNVTKNVKQAGYAPVPSTVTVTPPTISLNAVNDVLCSNNGSVNINISGGTPPYTFVWSNGATSEDISGLSAGAYSVTVTGGGASASSSFTVQQLQLTQPIITSMSDRTACSIKMNWTAVSGTANYKVQYKISSDTMWSPELPIGNVTSYNFSGLTSGTFYDFQVAAFCGNGNNSGYNSISDSTGHCEAISSSSVTNNSSTSVTVSWATPCYTIGYRLIYRQVGTNTWTSYFVFSPSKILNGLLPNTTYEYKIRNRCGDAPNVGLWTPNVSFTTPAMRVENELVNQSKNTFALYPNPTNSDVHISGSFNENAKTADLRIMNELGAVVFTQKINLEFGTFDLPLELPSSLSNGLYFVNVNSSSENVMTKLLLQR
ncbi:MAG: fibronectin type III domain-containing protein [Bacteroidota bacterium]